MSEFTDQIQNLSAVEKRALLARLLQQKSQNSIPKDYAVVHDWFTAQVAATPNAIALVFAGESVTYQTLNQQANNLAAALLAKDLGPGSLIATYLDSPLEQITALLGILKVGGICAPLDPNLPLSWITPILQTAQPVATICHTQPTAAWAASGGLLLPIQHLLAETSSTSEANPAVPAISTAPAYLATSSLALPEISHRALITELKHWQQHLSWTHGDTLLLTAAPQQNSAYWQQLLPLVCGGTLVVGDQLDTVTAKTVTAKTIVANLTQHQVTWVHLSATLLQQVLTLWETVSEPVPDTLKGIICTGEPLAPALIERYHNLLSRPLYYSYGLPETGAITWAVYQPGQPVTPQTIGQPLQPVYIVDSHNSLVPAGVVGTLAVGSPLANRYGNPAAAVGQFGTNPFNPQTIINHENASPLFKTTREGRRLQNGPLVLTTTWGSSCLLNDYCISIPQIETALLALWEVEDSCVLYRQTENGPGELVAYIVGKGIPSPQELIQQLHKSLPEVWIPKTYVNVTSLPITDGQCDRDRLTQLPVLDDTSLNSWESQLAQLPTIEQVAVLFQEKRKSLPRVHLADLLLHWQSKGAAHFESQIETDNSSSLDVADVPRSSIPALSDGGTIPESYLRNCTLSQHLYQTAETVVDAGCIHIQSDGTEFVCSYPELLETARCVLEGLRQQGIQPGELVIFQLPRSQDFIAAFWACVLGGVVPVPTSVPPTYDGDHSGVIKLQAIWEMLDCPPILTGQAQQAAHLAALETSWAIAPLKLLTVEVLSQYPAAIQDHSSQPDDVAVMMLTSGSTGLPKGVPLTHRNLLSHAAGSTVTNGFTSTDIVFNWMPLDHVGALIMLSITSVTLGCQQVHVPTDYILQQPLRWLDLIDRYRATITWAPNFAFTLICDCEQDIRQGHWDLSCMKFLLNGGEAIVAKTNRTFLKLLSLHGLPSTAIRPAYGMSEMSSGMTFCPRFSLETTTDDDAFVSVGPPIAGMTLRIVDSAGEVVPEGVVGRLQAQGACVITGYYRRPDADREAFTEDGWFKTGDLGFLKQGALTITGREKDVIIVNGCNYYSHEIETAVEEIDGIEATYTAACGVRDGGDTDQLAIFFHSTVGTESEQLAQLKAIRNQVIERIGINPSYLIPIAKEAVPKTAIGKIQRPQLSQRFAQGEFASILKRLDLLFENENTLPNWFYQPSWQHRELQPDQSLTLTGTTLVLFDTAGLGEACCQQLHQSNCDYVRVQLAETFERLEANYYSLNPRNPSHYKSLFQDLERRKIGPIRQVLHLWSYEETDARSLDQLEAAQDRGIYSLINLVQAWQQVQTEQPIRLLVTTQNAQKVLPGDVVAVAQAPLIGVIDSLTQELSWLQCRHVDLSVATPKDNTALLWAELTLAAPERAAAYRDNKRWIPGLAPVRLTENPLPSEPFQPGGLYLVTGGLGDLGFKIAEQLLRLYAAKVLLVGRTPVSAADNHEHTNTILDQTRLEKLCYLETLPGDVEYAVADVTDLEALKQTVVSAEARWGTSLLGLIHLAGIYREQSLVDTNLDSLGVVLKPKVQGTWVLDQLLRDYPDALFISSSSVVSYFGGALVGAYAAANRFQESFAHYQRARGRVNAHCLSWSTWENLGVSRQGPKELHQLRGYCSMTAQQALYSFRAALSQSVAHLIIGLDGGHNYIRKYLLADDTVELATHKAVVYFTTSPNLASSTEIRQLPLCDRFGTSSAYSAIALPEMPLTETGAIDRQALIRARLQARTGTSERVLPRTPLEQKVADIWQEVLGLETIGIFDSFFELGGNSLTAVKLATHISDTFQVDINLSRLFQTQTIADFAEFLEETTTIPAVPSLVPIQTQGDNRPVFFVHPVGGNVFCYQELAQHLGKEQPFYGLEVAVPSDQDDRQTSVPAMAKQYLDAIRTVQAEGPYYLGGWSLGGIIAYEMAQQLQSEGETVELLTLIDAYGANGVNIPVTISHADLLTAALEDLSGLMGKSMSLSVAELRDLSPDKQLQCAHAELQQSGLVPLTFTLEQLQQLWEIFQTNHEAWTQYHPKAYNGPVLLVVAEQTIPLANVTLEQFWRDRLGANMSVHVLSGDHYALLKMPVVQTLAKIIETAMN